MERAVIVYNPRARNAPRRERLQQAAASFKSQGWEIELQSTEAAGHATLLAREAAASGAAVVIACGGDGTLNEVVNGLVATPARLALVRGGTGNVFAKEIGVPKAPEAALRVLVEADVRRFDLGLANERHFLLMCGAGFDAAVVRRVPSRTKRLLGTTSYLLWGMAQAALYRSTPVRLRLNGDEEQEIDLYWLLLGNTRSYGGVLNITHQALADDGLLDAYLFSARRLPLVTAARLAVRRHDRARNVSFRRLRELSVITPGIPVQADGEYFGETPMTFSVAPAALSVLLPPGKGRQLLSGA